MGLFGESYLLFSIGTLQPIWEVLFDDCFHGDDNLCSPPLLAALHYSVVAGVMAGMLIIGYASHYTGRRLGSLITAGLMAFGAAGLTLAALCLTQNEATLVRAMVFFWTVFGMGVGGEYPLAASQASEKGSRSSGSSANTTIANNTSSSQNEKQQQSPTVAPLARDGLLVEDNNEDHNDDDKEAGDNGNDPTMSETDMTSSAAESRRGRQVQLVFSMQGLGILVNSITMTAMLFIINQDMSQLRRENDDWNNNGNDDDNNYQKYNVQSAAETALLTVWRTTYAFGTVVLFFVWYTRYLYLEESPVWLQHKREQREMQERQQEQQRPLHINFSASNKFQKGGAMHMDGDGRPPHSWDNNSSISRNNSNPWQAGGLTTTAFSKSGSQQQLSEAEATGTSTKGSQSLSGFGVAGFGSSSNGAVESGMLYPSLEKEQMQSQRMAQALGQTAATGSAANNSNSSINNSKPPKQVIQQPPHQQQQQQPYAFNIVQSHLSMVSTVSSLSAPSVLAHNQCGDDEYFYHFLPEARPSLSGKWRLLGRHYSVRLVGASLSWLLWDVAFYGNKLFQSTFLLALLGKKYNNGDENDDADGTSNMNNYNGVEDEDEITQVLLDLSLCATLNAAVAFCGYLVAAMLVDQPWIGRRGLQIWGFLVTGTLFVLCGFLLDRLQASSSSSWLVTSFYLGTSFFGQVGPNATTFLIPAEIFPTEIRTICHGIAAASGKLGALLAAVAFHQAQSDLDMFLFSGYCSLLAGALTYYTIPESLGLPLHELDRKWNAMVQNKPYTGLANQARYLSLFERQQLSQQEERRTNQQQEQQDVDHVDLY
mmetsp:Transcript_8427/g.23347  ORF Transcript_8427/g.23347 Transcript_8427/m.23347 type:complete len:822 (-) Transcript_8427:167-2632(-)